MAMDQLILLGMGTTCVIFNNVFLKIIHFKSRGLCRGTVWLRSQELNCGHYNSTSWSDGLSNLANWIYG